MRNLYQPQFEESDGTSQIEMLVAFTLVWFTYAHELAQYPLLLWVKYGHRPHKEVAGEPKVI